MGKPICVSGIQPTGNLHIGNYLGAVKNFVEIQNSDKYELYLFIADLHSLTGNMKADERRAQILRTAAELVAAGVDPEKTTLFVQSHIAEHAELAWIFNCVTQVTDLEKMIQYKDKSSRQEGNINAGLLTYPILQAADILLYCGEFVPVGQDQIQHVELTRVVARAFNNRYGEYFPEAKSLLTLTPKVMSLLIPEKKMSKSLGAGHVIELADAPEIISAKVKKAVTATVGGGEAPGVINLLSMLKEFGAVQKYNEFVEAEKTGTIKYGELKTAVAETVAGYFTEFRRRRAELLEKHDELAEILLRGASKARPMAESTMNEVRQRVGLR